MRQESRWSWNACFLLTECWQSNHNYFNRTEKILGVWQIDQNRPSLFHIKVEDHQKRTITVYSCPPNVCCLNTKRTKYTLIWHTCQMTYTVWYTKKIKNLHWTQRAHQTLTRPKTKLVLKQPKQTLNKSNLYDKQHCDSNAIGF